MDKVDMVAKPWSWLTPPGVHRWRGLRSRLGFWGRVLAHLGPVLAARCGLPLTDRMGLP